MKKTSKIRKEIEHQAENATRWIGSTKSIIFHSILFLVAFILPIFGADFDRMLLVLTTAVSLEAIYLAIFIQMTVNKNTQDIEEIQEDVEEIQEDVEEIQEEQEKDSKEDKKIQKKLDLLNNIQQTLHELSDEIEQMKKK